MKKFILWLFITLSVVYGENENYKEEDEVQVPQKNNSIHLQCFDVFLPLIARLSNEAKEASDNCVNTANADKERELTSIKNTRSELHSEVKRIKETLTHCSSRSDHLGYFECLNGIVEVDRKIVADIAMKSSTYSNKVKKIEEQEIKCFRNSVSKLQDKISNGINNLHYCLMSEDSSVPGEHLKHGHYSGTQSSADFIRGNHIHTSTTTTSSPFVENYDDVDYNNYNG